MGGHNSKITSDESELHANGLKVKFNFNDPSSMRVAAWVLESSKYNLDHSTDVSPDEFQGQVAGNPQQRVNPGQQETAGCLTTFLNQFRKIEFAHSNNKLEAFPSSVFSHRHLTTLDLHSNYIKLIPERIIVLHCLVRLNLHDNMLPTVPPQIGALTRLQVLTLHRNRIASLPASIGNLRSLVVFHVFDNLLVSIPEALVSLKSLEDFRGMESSALLIITFAMM
jgi:Leucine-rich repeat (LRR) protein